MLGRLGVDRGEITLLEEQVLHTLAEAAVPLDPRQLKEELGESVRNLGEEGKKKGAATTLPTALGILQSQGRIRRVPPTGAWTSSATPTNSGTCRRARSTTTKPAPS